MHTHMFTKGGGAHSSRLVMPALATCPGPIARNSRLEHTVRWGEGRGGYAPWGPAHDCVPLSPGWGPAHD